MPFTPYHWGLTLVLPELACRDNAPRKWSLQTMGVLLVTIPDIEGFANLVLGIETIAIHGPLHSFFSCLVIGLLGSMLFYLTTKLPPIRASFGVFPKWGFLYLSLVPLVFHLFIDLPMYTDIEPWWPFSTTPTSFYHQSGSMISFFITLVAWIGYLSLLFVRLFWSVMDR